MRTSCRIVNYYFIGKHRIELNNLIHYKVFFCFPNYWIVYYLFYLINLLRCLVSCLFNIFQKTIDQLNRDFGIRSAGKTMDRASQTEAVLQKKDLLSSSVSTNSVDIDNPGRKGA